jgi:hypothetical protein
VSPPTTRPCRTPCAVWVRRTEEPRLDGTVAFAPAQFNLGPWGVFGGGGLLTGGIRSSCGLRTCGGCTFGTCSLGGAGGLGFTLGGGTGLEGGRTTFGGGTGLMGGGIGRGTFGGGTTTFGGGTGLMGGGTGRGTFGGGTTTFGGGTGLMGGGTGGGTFGGPPAPGGTQTPSALRTSRPGQAGGCLSGTGLPIRGTHWPRSLRISLGLHG